MLNNVKKQVNEIDLAEQGFPMYDDQPVYDN